jgi:hypothetical protein
MPCIGFQCPDKKAIGFDRCLEKCQMGDRCLSRSSLLLLSRQRKWSGVPSTTQLINGTMLEFLKLTNDFYESPFDGAFKIIGTRAHKGLEMQNDDLSLLEERFEDEGMTGIADFLEIEDGLNTLGDHKVAGWFKVVKAKGYHREIIETDEVFKSGERKGQKKTKKIWIKGEPDCREYELQLNRYRMNFEKAGFRVDRMKIEAIVRDHKNSPKVEGEYLLKPIEYFEIRKLPDDQVLEFFSKKREDLLRALQDGSWNIPCSPDERWEDKRCLAYCSVNDKCPYYLANLKDKGGENDQDN